MTRALSKTGCACPATGETDETHGHLASMEFVCVCVESHSERRSRATSAIRKRRRGGPRRNRVANARTSRFTWSSRSGGKPLGGRRADRRQSQRRTAAGCFDGGVRAGRVTQRARARAVASGSSASGAANAP